MGAGSSRQTTCRAGHILSVRARIRIIAPARIRAVLTFENMLKFGTRSGGLPFGQDSKPNVPSAARNRCRSATSCRLAKAVHPLSSNRTTRSRVPRDMIISRTPFRISLFGGGTDYPAWFREHGGAVLGLAIDKYCYITLRRLPPFFEHRSRIVYSQVELVNTVSEIRHPAVRAVLSDLGITEGLEIHHDADLPARSGLGSSSSFTVGLLNALHALNSKMIAKRDLACEAIRIEQDVLKEQVGSQDQVWAAYGGFNRCEFFRDGNFAVSPIILSPARRHELNRSLMLFFTGFSRFATDFAQDQVNNIPNRKSQLMAIRRMVDSASEILPGREDAVARTRRTAARGLAAQARTRRQRIQLADRRNLQCRARGWRHRRQAPRRRRRRLHGLLRGGGGAGPGARAA